MTGLERSKQYILGVVVDRRRTASVTARGRRQQSSLPSSGLSLSHNSFRRRSSRRPFFGPDQVVKSAPVKSPLDWFGRTLYRCGGVVRVLVGATSKNATITGETQC